MTKTSLGHDSALASVSLLEFIPAGNYYMPSPTHRSNVAALAQHFRWHNWLALLNDSAD